jgi:lysozyme
MVVLPSFYYLMGGISMYLNKDGLGMIQKFEGCRLKAYDDAQPKVKLTATTKIKGTLTIGTGHTGSVDGKKIAWNTTITKQKAMELLEKDAEKFEHLVAKYDKKYHWNQNEFNALTCFCFNIGNIDQLTNHGTRTRAEIAAKFVEYRSKGTIWENGLKKRRLAERKVFLKKCK